MTDISWVNLASTAGATAFVVLLIQYIKPLLPNVNTRLMVLIASITIMQIVTGVFGGAIVDHVLALINAFVVASAAMGAYDITFKKLEERQDG